MPRRAVAPSGRALLVAALIVALVAGAAVGASDGGSDSDPAATSDGAPQSSLQAESFEQEFRVEVYANGSARWTFVYRRPLTTESERADFREYASRFNANETDLYRDFETRARAVTSRGTEETDRRMNATAFHRQAYVSDLGNAGIVEMSFLWPRFGAVDGSRVVVGDVFEGGLYVAPEQRFVVTWVTGLAPVEVDPEPTARTTDSLTWTGGAEGRQFLDGRPRIVLADANMTTTATAAGTDGTDGPTTTTTATGTDAAGGPTDPPGADGSGSGLLPAAVGLLVVVLGVGVTVAYRNGAFDDALGGSSGPGDGPGGSGGPGGPGGSGRPGAGSGSDATSGSGAGAVDDGSTGTSFEPAVSEEDLMTDEHRVTRLLEESGGRMKQVSIVEETDWSKSKVSMLLSDMEEEGRISKLRVGRENIISLPGRKPDVAGSPFDDEESGE